MRIMGIINLTPDSFYDGGRHNCLEYALKQFDALVLAGADIIDIGAESTRPGSDPVSATEELNRLLPVLKAIPKDRVQISVDSCKLEVQAEALKHGAHMINDIYGGSRELYILAEKYQAGLCLMHTPAPPKIMQEMTQYQDVVTEIYDYFLEKKTDWQQFDLPNVWVDPGIGFGKNLDQNILLLNHLNRFRELGSGVLLGVSRKSLIAKMTKNPDLLPQDRLPGSLAMAIHAKNCGVQVLRVHDVAETRQALTVADFLHPQSVRSPSIHLSGIEVQTEIGVLAEEKGVLQDLIVHLEIWGDFLRVCQTDNLKDGLDYVLVVNAVREYCQTNQKKTLESFVSDLSQYLGQRFKLVRVAVEVEKPRYQKTLKLGKISVRGVFNA